MDELRVDQEVAVLLDKAQIPMTEQWHARVLAGVAKASPARPTRWRRTVVLAGLAVVLVGLGFVPFPAGSAKGAFGRALAAANLSPGVHVAGRIWGPVGEWRFEQWFTQDGFKRFDLYDGERVVMRWLYDPGVRMICPRVGETEPLKRLGRLEDERKISPPGGAWQSAPLIGPDAEVHAYRGQQEAAEVYDRRELDVLPFPYELRQDQNPTRLDFWRRVEDWKGALEMRVEERQRYTLWGGRRTVADVYGRRRKDSWADVLILGNLMGPVFPWLQHGDDVWIHMEADPKTGALLALEQYQRADGKWQLGYCVDMIELDVEVGREVREPELPEHHVQVEDTWWKERLAQTLAAGESQDWLVVLHSLEMNRKGDVFVTVSRRPKVEVPSDMDQDHKQIAPVRFFSLEAFDELGTRYVLAGQEPRRWYNPAFSRGPIPDRFLDGPPDIQARVCLTPELQEPSGHVPRTLTLVFSSMPAARPTPILEVQTVTFPGLAASPQQPGGDLIAEAIHTTER